ncbi:MAG: helix-turn-helix transcriptional regulator [Actinomycetes bacterium]
MPSVEVRTLKTLGQVVRHARTSSGIRASDLADELAITPQYLSAIENGRPTLFSIRLFRILRRLGITVTLTYEPPHDEVRDA